MNNDFDIFVIEVFLKEYCNITSADRSKVLLKCWEQTLIVKVDIAWFSSVARDTSIPSIEE